MEWPWGPSSSLLHEKWARKKNKFSKNPASGKTLRSVSKWFLLSAIAQSKNSSGRSLLPESSNFSFRRCNKIQERNFQQFFLLFSCRAHFFDSWKWIFETKHRWDETYVLTRNYYWSRGTRLFVLIRISLKEGFSKVISLSSNCWFMMILWRARIWLACCRRSFLIATAHLRAYIIPYQRTTRGGRFEFNEL